MGTASRKQPLYDQLVDLLTEKIENECSVGDLLPSERELSERYGLSRTTVRLALQELERLGLIVRRHGRGTFVADKSPVRTDLTQIYSFTEQMREMGRKPRTAVLEFCEVEADKRVAAGMGAKVGARVLRLRRLRLANEVPMMVETTYLPLRKFISLTRAELERKPLYTIIEQDYHEAIRVAVEEFRASLAGPDDARLLGITEGDPVLDLVRTTQNLGNEIIEYTLSVARADQFAYKVYHYRNGE